MGRIPERDGNQAATSSIISSVRATFERINTLVSDPRAAIRRYAVLRQLNTRMRNPETPVRSLEDARSRFLQQEPSEIAHTVEMVRQAVENGAIEPGSLPLMEKAGEQITILTELKACMRDPETPVRSKEDARSRFLQQEPSEIAETIVILGEAARNDVVDEGTLQWMGKAAMELINEPRAEIPDEAWVRIVAALAIAGINMPAQQPNVPLADIDAFDNAIAADNNHGIGPRPLETLLAIDANEFAFVGAFPQFPKERE